MLRFLFFYLLISLLIAGCNKVEDTPTPDLIEGLTLKPIQLELVFGGKIDLELLTLNPIPSDAIIRIKEKPKHGVILLDEVRKIFVYSADTLDAFSLDSATYEVCNSKSCKEGKIRFLRISETNCQIEALPYNFVVSPGNQFLPLPETFACGGEISQLIGHDPNFFSLENGKVKAAFPDFFQDSLSFNYVVCSPDNQCDTGSISVVVQLLPNYCSGQFSPANDVIKILPSFIAFSINYDSLFRNDKSCPGDIKPESLSIIQGPSRGTTSLRSNLQGRFIRFIKDSSFVAGRDSLTYQIIGESGGTGTAKIFIQFQ